MKTFLRCQVCPPVKSGSGNSLLVLTLRSYLRLALGAQHTAERSTSCGPGRIGSRPGHPAAVSSAYEAPHFGSCLGHITYFPLPALGEHANAGVDLTGETHETRISSHSTRSV